MTDQTFDSFIKQVHALLEPTASGKGYNTTGVDGHNPLYEFVASFAGPHHALGEIVYKAKRYEAKRNLEDVLKIAAWAFLVYKHHADVAQQDEAKPRLAAAIERAMETHNVKVAAKALDIAREAEAIATGDGPTVKFVKVGEYDQWIKA